MDVNECTCWYNASKYLIHFLQLSVLLGVTMDGAVYRGSAGVY